MRSGPHMFPAEVHGGDFPDFAIVSEQPSGMPYEEQKASDKSLHRASPPKARCCIQIMCDSKDYERIAIMVMVAKEHCCWTKEFRMCCHPTEVPDNDALEAEKQRYMQMVVKKSMMW